ncbi:hypothetical protein N8I84_40930 [Streptomyces cynarae]|uniref:Oligopeptide/dipeptide ABC transporter C-terminal domain-containing protein n=1 Tax=Streptomyces cynarae TaxID=2981134 RepID=A0ABY6EGB0_9ACTN|nr:oligopeptide/dipeptide ABC transporter ATP-binding protein [Streptomyces cynarae]UXY24321.1 hypothetical protein N8I84_40930 [Streptomyces cynarae]
MSPLISRYARIRKDSHQRDVQRFPAAPACAPCTAGLLASRPSTVDVQRLRAIPGRPVSAFEVGPGCVFANRCTFAQDRCRTERPQLRVVDQHEVACHRAEELHGRLPLDAPQRSETT